jgi:hypothetical protein
MRWGQVECFKKILGRRGVWVLEKISPGWHIYNGSKNWPIPSLDFNTCPTLVTSYGISNVTLRLKPWIVVLEIVHNGETLHI